MAENVRMIQSKYMCDENKSERECREEFINNHPYFEYVYVPGDGNCLFHTLAEFYRRSGKTIPGVANPTDHEELRSYIVQQFNIIMQGQPRAALDLLIDQDYRLRTEQQEEYIKNLEATISHLQDKGENTMNAVIQLTSLQPIVPRNIQTIIAELAQSRTWYNAAFDLMVVCIPVILNVNLSMYSSLLPTPNRRYITIDNMLFTPNGGRPVDTTIYLLLSGNHYGLLYPNDISASSLQSVLQSNKKVQTQRNARMAASMAASERQELESRPMTNMERALAASLDTKASNNERRRQQEQAALAAMPAAMPAASAAMPAARSNNNLNAALAASMRTMSINTERRRQEQEKLNAALAASMSTMSINNKRPRQQEQAHLSPALAALPAVNMWEHIKNNNEKYANKFNKLNITNNSRRRKEAEKENLNAAFEESQRAASSAAASSAASAPNNNYNNAEENYSEPQESQINYNSNASSVVSNASSVGNIPNYTNNNMTQNLPIDTLTKEYIKGQLKLYGVPFNHSNSKNDLYQKLVDPFKRNMNIRTKNTMKINKYANKVASRKAARNARRASKGAAKGAARNTKKANKK